MVGQSMLPMCQKISLDTDHGEIIYRTHLVIPLILQSEVLEHFHNGHSGMTKCRERANMSVLWPGICCDIQNKVSMGDFCQGNLPTQRKEPL